jgi:hypothetical protein
MKKYIFYLSLLLLILIVVTRIVYINSVDYILVNKLNNQKQLIVKYESFINDGLLEKNTPFTSDILQSVIDSAWSYKDTPNEIGGISKNGIDASGLVYMALKKNSNEEFPRIAHG